VRTRSLQESSRSPSLFWNMLARAKRSYRGESDRSLGVQDSACNQDSAPSFAQMHAPTRTESAPAPRHDTTSHRFTASRGEQCVQPCALAAGPDYIRHRILRDTLAPYLVRSGHGPEDSSLSYPGGRRPLIERGFDPLGNGKRYGCGLPCQSDPLRPSAPDASGSHASPNRQAPIYETRNQTPWPALHNPVWHAGEVP
jgi:hypothetical protein